MKSVFERNLPSISDEIRCAVHDEFDGGMLSLSSPDHVNR